MKLQHNLWGGEGGGIIFYSPNIALIAIVIFRDIATVSLQWRIEGCLCFSNVPFVFRLDPFFSVLLPSTPTISSYGSRVWCRRNTATVRQHGHLLVICWLSACWMVIFVLSLSWHVFFLTVCVSWRLPATFWDQCWAEGSSVRCHRGADQQNAPEITTVTLCNSKPDKVPWPFFFLSMSDFDYTTVCHLKKNGGYIYAKSGWQYRF